MAGDNGVSTACAKGEGQTTVSCQPPMSDVEFFVGGDDTFKAMLAAMRTCKDDSHFIYLMGWYCDVDFPLDSSDPNSTLRKVFTSLDSQGVQIRALLWAQVLGNYDQHKAALMACGYGLGAAITLPMYGFGGPIGAYLASQIASHPMVTMNRKTVDFINSLPGFVPFPSAISPMRGCGAIHDAYHGQLRTHHQKVLVVGGADGLIAFCGGCDINPDRTNPMGTAGVTVFAPGAPLHDVHSQVKGAAAMDLYQVFNERWINHPDHTAIDQACAANTHVTSALLPPPPDQAPHNSQYVTVRGTYSTGGKPLPSPRTGIADLLTSAINSASTFIYVEDQYLYNPKVAKLLAARLKGDLKFLIIVICADALATVPQISYRRGQFLQELAWADSTPSKVKVFQRKYGDPKSPLAGSYVHSKTWIFDDNYAITGSANIDMRGWFSSSETNVAVRDSTSSDLTVNHKAHDLRMRLWSKHLGISPAVQANPQEWDPLPASASVEPYVRSPMSGLETDFINNQRKDYDDLWDIGIDPFI